MVPYGYHSIVGWPKATIRDWSIPFDHRYSRYGGDSNDGLPSNIQLFSQLISSFTWGGFQRTRKFRQVWNCTANCTRYQTLLNHLRYSALTTEPVPLTTAYSPVTCCYRSEYAAWADSRPKKGAGKQCHTEYSLVVLLHKFQSVWFDRKWQHDHHCW